VWGGQSSAALDAYLNDGAAYNPDANTWRSLAPSPLSKRSHFGAVWTGKHLVIIGGQTTEAINADGTLNLANDAATYDPQTDTWSAAFETGLGGRAYLAAAWAEEPARIVAWGGLSPPRIPRTTGVLIRPEEATHADLPPMTGSGRVAQGFWLLGKFYVLQADSCVSSCADAWTWDPGLNLWRQQTSFPAGLEGAPYRLVTMTPHPSGNGQLAVFGGRARDGSAKYSNQGFVYNAADATWTVLPELKESLLPAGHSRVGFFVAGRFGFYGGARANVLGGGALLAADGLGWELLPESGAGPRLHHSVVAVGHDAILWGGQDDTGKSHDDGVIFRVR
jgi:hypothetical protein